MDLLIHLPGRPKGGVGILYKKSLCNKISPIKSTNRRVCGIKINFSPVFSCLLLSVYLPCDNYCNIVSNEYLECIEHIESLYNTIDCNSFICCGDYNSCFERLNAQTECLNNFITRNNLEVSWNNSVSKKEFTYTNLSLNHFSCIDHILITRNLFDCIVDNYVVNEPCNPSNHNIVYLCISITGFNQVIETNSNRPFKPNCIWSKATISDIEQYQLALDRRLNQIEFNKSVFYCNDLHCTNVEHRHAIDRLCHTLIEYCVESGDECIPRALYPLYGGHL